jgi:hypothetical protein
VVKFAIEVTQEADDETMDNMADIVETSLNLALAVDTAEVNLMLMRGVILQGDTHNIVHDMIMDGSPTPETTEALIKNLYRQVANSIIIIHELTKEEDDATDIQETYT